MGLNENAPGYCIEDNLEDTLDKETVRRIKKRVSLSQTRLVWVLLSNIVGGIGLYVFFFNARSVEYAFENIILTIVPILALDGFGYLGYLGYLFFHKIPEEIYQEQKGVIAKHLPKQLLINIEHTPDVITNTKDGKNTKVAALYITSTENRKIIELRALVNFEHFYFVNDKKYVGQAGYQLNTPLNWVGDDQPQTATELFPQVGKIVLICENIDGELDDGQKLWVARMGSKLVPMPPRFGEESVFRIDVTFQGKLEGEYEIKSFYYKEMIYAKPGDQRILFLDDAEKAYSDIPKRLIERSRSDDKFLKVGNK
jgi:hypothetical protein